MNYKRTIMVLLIHKLSSTYRGRTRGVNRKTTSIFKFSRAWSVGLSTFFFYYIGLRALEVVTNVQLFS